MTGTAHAEKGLTVDPQSPAGVEYAVPLDSGRGHGNGSGGGGGSGAAANGSPGLFGEGITAPREKGSGSSGKSGGAAGSRSGGHGGSKRSGSRGTTGSATAPVTPVRASASYSPTGPLAGLIAAIVAAGAGLGLFLRYRARSS